MPVAFPRPWSAPRDAPLLQRSATLALVVALHLLLLFLLLRLAPPTFAPMQPRRAPLTVDLIPEAEIAPATTRTTEAPRPRTGSARPRAAEPAPARQPPPPPVPPPPPLPAPTPSIWSQVIPMTREQMAAADIARFPSRAATSGSGEGERGASADLGSGDAGPGRGPNGEPLYNADWYRRPTRAQLAFYLPPGGREGWGMIACRTVLDYRVEDCREIAESPVGSGLSGAVRQAAWQFRVLPPRRGGRTLVGSWVRIRIEYTSDGPE